MKIEVTVGMILELPEGATLESDYKGDPIRVRLADGRKVNFWPSAEIVACPDSDEESYEDVTTHEMEEKTGISCVEYTDREVVVLEGDWEEGDG